MDAAQAIQLPSLPQGGWAVGVSGGADSVALLLLLREQTSIPLHVVHLDHELRGEASRGDAVFVADVAGKLKIPATIERRSAIEPHLTQLPANPSARYRAIRLTLFKRVVGQHQLQGVLLAHQCDDVAETVLQRLLRGSGTAGLRGIAADSVLDGLRIVRPLLAVRRKALREFLESRQQIWREDASNQSDDYLRNRLRKLLADKPSLTDALLVLSQACGDLAEWTERTAPSLAEVFAAKTLNSLPTILARQSARNWLLETGVASEELTPDGVDRLILMSADAASPPVHQFPGGVTVRRRAGKIHRAK